MTKLLFYLVLKPLSLLPLAVLYRLSDLMAWLFSHVIPYRQKVIRTNLENSFPDKSDKEIDQLAKGFTAHLCDLIVESIRLFSISKKELRRRFKVSNPELIDHYFHQGKSVIICAGHYNNWEMAGAALNALIEHQVIGLYAPLSNKYFDKKFKESRTRTGTEMVSKHDIKPLIADYIKQDNPVALVFGTDQSPTSSKKVYWTEFLSQKTAVMFGSEKYAKEMDAPVVFAYIAKTKRGHYEMTFELIEEDPYYAPHCSITEQHTRLLEEQIMQAPQYWLWSHKRWKRKVERDYPDGVIPEAQYQV